MSDNFMPWENCTWVTRHFLQLAKLSDGHKRARWLRKALDSANCDQLAAGRYPVGLGNLPAPPSDPNYDGQAFAVAVANAPVGINQTWPT